MMKNSLLTLFCISSQLVTAQNLPDLTLANLNLAHANVPQGQVLYYKFDLKNIGTGNAHGSFSVKAYFSRDAYLSADDIQDGIVPTANFAAGFSVSQVQGASTVRNPIGIGNYYLILKVDADNYIAESNENNNLLVSAPITVTPVNTNSCRYQDSLQLVRLYQATNGAHWINKWNRNTPLETWHGVRLSANGCVNALELEYNGLVGTLPALNLPHLEFLALRENALSGWIPNLNCPKLIYLYLAENRFSGPVPTLNCPNLRVLMLHNNYLTGSIPTLNCPNLRELGLSNNYLTGTIPQFNLPSLAALFLDHNRLTGNLPVLNYPHLNRLYLNDNQLSGCIPNSYKSLCGKSVDLSNNPNLAVQDFTAFCSPSNTGMCSGADLTMANLNWVTPSIPQGQVLHYNFDLKNIGTAPIPGNFNVKAYISRDNILSSDDVQDGIVPTANFNAGFTSFQVAGASRMRSPIGTGQYYLILKADADNQIIESNENNNIIVSRPITITPPLSNLPDLTMANLNLTQNTVQQGQILNYKFDLKNIGIAAASGSFNVKAYISRDNILSSDDVPDGIVPTGNFAAGFSVSQVAGASRMRSPIGTGPYYLILKADADNQIAESNENNNLLVSLPFRVTPHNETICLNQFDIQGYVARECGIAYTYHDVTGSLQQYGSHIEAGFQVMFQTSSTYHNSYAYLYARNGVATPQWGSKYRNCPGNWVYFTAEGVKVSSARWWINTEEYSKIYMRVRTVGNASNPDTLYIELDSTTNLNFPTHLWVTVRKSQNCNTCFATDQTPPIITGCSTTPIVDVRILGDGTYFSTWSVIHELGLGLQFSDNCLLARDLPYSVPSSGTVNSGEILPFKFIQFDLAGNKAVCETRLRFVTDSSSIYCASKGKLPWSAWIAGVQFSNLNNPSTQQSYSNFTGVAAAVVRSASHSFTLNQGYNWAGNPSNAAAEWRVWIDYNQNNRFDGHELAASGTHTTSTATITIPPTASLGNTRMRVSLKKTGAPTACEVFEEGEVEDYTVNIATPGGYEKIQNIENQSVTNFNVFPNPAQGEVFLDLKDFENQKVEISLSDVAGKAIWNQTLENATASPHRLDVSKLKNGAYLIHIQSVTRKIARTLYILN